jgi:hypothetical protein
MKWRRGFVKLILEVSICLLALVLVNALLFGPILDARFKKGPLDPELINGNCPLHDVSLREGIVPILYGIPDFQEGYSAAKRDQFPLANSRYLGGCYLQKSLLARVRYCPECRKAEKEWKENTKQN